MNAENFVKELSKIPFSIEELHSQGLSKDYIEELMSSYKIEMKPLSTSYSGNPVLELVENYDSSNLEIGMICFDENIEIGEDYIFFGKFEIDDLAINKNLGQVVMLEDGSDNVLYECASSGANFLSATIVAANFLEKRANDDAIYNNQELAISMAEECAERAGGKNEYQNFYKMLFGCDL
jgi:hypothetical protein